MPQLSIDIPVLFGGPLDSPGTLELLALCLVFAGVALTYDLLFGFTGLLSFGHALYFALGVYLTTIALTKWEWGLAQTLLVVVGAGILVAARRSARSACASSGIAFAMVTLAFAQAGQVLVQKNPDGLTGGEEGLGLNFEPLPDVVRRRREHEEPLLARARLRGVRVRRRPLGGQQLARATCGRRSARTSAGSR